MSLFTLRLELENLNENILKLFHERKTISGNIQKVKSDTGSKTFDPAREIQLFKVLAPELSKLSLKELFAFSLLMEDHAGSAYPAWSDGVQYQQGSASKERPGINPLLLLLFHPEKIKVDTLKNEYRNLIKLVEERQ